MSYGFLQFLFVLVLIGMVAVPLWVIWAIDQYPASTAKTNKYPSRAYKTRYGQRRGTRRGRPR